MLGGFALSLKAHVYCLGILTLALLLGVQVIVVAGMLAAFLGDKDLVTVILAHVTSRLNYCNILHVELPLKTLWKLVQIVAASTLTGTNRLDHLTPILQDWIGSRFLSGSNSWSGSVL